MSIAESSTALDTTWTEQTYVAFTAGTLASVTEMITEVESKLRRGTLSATTTPSTTEVQRWLIRGKQELAETKRYTWKRRYAYADTVSAQYRYALPPDFEGGLFNLKDLTNDRGIDVWPTHIFDLKFPDPSEETNDEPIAAAIKNRELWLVPPPNGAYRLELEYDRSGDDVTSTDFSWLPEIDRFRCCDYAVAQAFRSLHMFDVAQLYSADWKEGVGKAIRADGKRKWSRMNYQCISWLQAGAIKDYQQEP